MSEDSPQEFVRFCFSGRPKESPEDCLPWLNQRTQAITDPVLRLHNEAIDFYLLTSPQPEEQATKQAVLQQFIRVIVDGMGKVEVSTPFLSTKMYMAGTELQIFLLVQNVRSSGLALKKLMKESPCFDSVREQNAGEGKFDLQKVSCCWEETSIIIRVVEQDWSDYLKALQESFQYIYELKYLYFIVTCMTRQRGMQNQVSSPLIAGILSVFYYERRKQKTRTLTQNILKFIEYFGVGPFQDRRINYLGLNRYEVLQQNGDNNQFSFWISPRVNLGCGLLKELFSVFKNRYRIISNYNFVDEKSILAWLTNPSGEVFSYR